MNYIKSPHEIERISFFIIEKLIKEAGYIYPYDILQIAKRIVHTAGYVSILDNFDFSSNIVEVFKCMIRKNYTIVTDTQMAKAGITVPFSLQYERKRIKCYSQDRDVVKSAKEEGITRAIVSCDKAVSFPDNKIFVIGNSPTFLFRLLEHIDANHVNNILVVGVPVGFVGAKESKAELARKKVPYITIHGTRGGTTYAVAIVNALFRLLRR